MITRNKGLIGIVLAVFLLLLVPLIAMSYTEEVNWTLTDFIVAACLLLATGLTIDLLIRKVKKVNYRIAMVLTVIAVLAIVWVQLAVGLF